jgi:multidrug efflux pump subunit AcrA (membrane-fusion protein)
VRVDVPLVDAAKVGVGQAAEVIVDVLPDRIFNGKVTRFVHEADVQKNTVQVKVAIEAPSPEIKPEMLARARFLATAGAQGAGAENHAGSRLFVPRNGINGQDGQSFVWLADQVENIARRQEVTTGRSVVDGWVVVMEGLRPGDRVIVDPPVNLQEGQRIRLIEESGD